MAATSLQHKAVSRAKRVLKKEGTDCSVESAEPLRVTVTKFIMARGNNGKDAKLLPMPPAGEGGPDSDDPDGDTPSSDVTQDVLSI